MSGNSTRGLIRVTQQPRRLHLPQLTPRTQLQPTPCLFCERRCASNVRQFSASARRKQKRDSFTSRLRDALSRTPVIWKPIPIGLGIGFLGASQFYKVNQREQAAYDEEERQSRVGDNGERPKKRARVRPSGPWTVQLMSYLPLKGISRAWGWFNELTIPYYLRVPGFKLYSWVFGVNLSEVAEPDLHVYPNLASFFYRTLKPGVRPLSPDLSAILSPTDGKVLAFGTIEHGEVEQIKGMTYSLEALLGSSSPTFDGEPEEIQASQKKAEQDLRSDEKIRADEEFANVNGISYTLPSGSDGSGRKSVVTDASTKSKSSSVAEVRADFALADSKRSWLFFQSPKVATALYYIVIYLAPGDYHRFHSPVSWVVEKRRHFAGELYSVSPYLQRTLPGLFTLNERVVLLGRWKHGFFSYTPVGATNVGSIVVNFDKELRTNSLRTDTEADKAAEEAAARGEPYCGYSEAVYQQASTVLGGHALRRGEEMGGFQLGSSIVMVFEAPKGQRPTFDEGYLDEGLKGGWQWSVKKGMKVKVGEALGRCNDE